MDPRSVLIVDDHPIVRHGLQRMIDAEPDLRVCGEAASQAEARELARELAPDAVIVDLSLEHGDGLALVNELFAENPELRMLVLSMHDETIYAERLLASGAKGYIMKQAASDQLLVALRRVLDGELYLSEALSKRLGERRADDMPDRVADPISRLKDRELQVLTLLGRGYSTRDIATELGLNVKTIDSHRQSIKKKLRLETGNQLLKYALKWFASKDYR